MPGRAAKVVVTVSGTRGVVQPATGSQPVAC
jgi:hypothetical protein